MGTDFTPLWMFVALFAALAAGFHISFALAAISLIFAYFLWGGPGMLVLVSAVWSTMNNFALLAIPLFIFMAMVFEKSMLVKELYGAFYKWSGPVRGGLGVATILAGAVIGAISGVVAAGVIGLGLIALPQMEQHKYDRNVNLGSILAGGTLGQLIPPSLVMVIYGAVTGVSVGNLFAAGVSAGLTLSALFCIYILIRSFISKHLCPALSLDERATWKEKFVAIKGLIIPGLIIIMCLGAIFSGAATPTEGAGVGAFASLLFSVLTGRCSWSALRESALGTLKVSSMVGWMIAGASAFGSVFAGIGGKEVVMNIAMGMPGGKWGFLVASIFFIFFLGMFLETAGLIMLAAPIVSPVIHNLGFEPLWWGIIFMTLLQCAYLSPPFGMSLFYLKGVTPDYISLEQIYRASIPFILLQLVCVLLIIFFPAFGLWLPRLLMQ